MSVQALPATTRAQPNKNRLVASAEKNPDYRTVRTRMINTAPTALNTPANK
ncbi:hypothetical protein COFA105466_08830 [Corynebacterium falsenii]